MDEASKTKKYFGSLEKRVFQGQGIDIGCGNDPIFEDVRRFDIGDGDANKITKYVKEKFDYVFSSHCLEHMENPKKALKEWWDLLKYNGYMYIIVPDEDLYEQGNWPSSNVDHRTTFTISKKNSWSPVSYNILDLIKKLPHAKILKIEQQDMGYDYSLVGKNIDQTLQEAVAQICFVLQKTIENEKLVHIGIKYFAYRLLTNFTFGKKKDYYRQMKREYKKYKENKS